MTKWTIEPAHDKFRILREWGFGRQYIIGVVNTRENAEEIVRTREEHGRMVEFIKVISDINPENYQRLEREYSVQLFESLKRTAENLLKSIEGE